MTRTRRAFVLGSGIAGLTLAELLARNGYRITLVERAATLGGDASRSTQNWFHTGWLYAALPNDAAMLGCHQALKLFHSIYGHTLPPEVLNLRVDSRGVGYDASPEGWFAPERVLYAYALRTAELSWFERMTWPLHLRSLAFPRLRALGYDTAPLPEAPEALAALLDRWEGEPNGNEKYAVVRSTDAQINTRRVLDTLLSLLGSGTEVLRRAEYSLVPRGRRTVLKINGDWHAPDLVIVATGKCVPSQLSELGQEGLARRFKSISSPIVVLNRALDLPNFIRFTPRLPHTLNHIKYDIRGLGARSTIGSYEYYPADRVPDISPFANRICKRLGVSEADVAGVYYGTKTELTGTAERRYNHAVGRVNDNTYFAIAGKFSQFPVLARDFAARAQLRTGPAPSNREKLEAEVGPTLPEQCVHALEAQHPTTAVPLQQVSALETRNARWREGKRD